MYVDFEELSKQKKEQILKSGQYCSMEVIIGKNDRSPIMNICVEQVGSKEIALLMLTMKDAIVQLAKKDPLAYHIFQNSKIESTLVEKDDIDKHIPKID